MHAADGARDCSSRTGSPALSFPASRILLTPRSFAMIPAPSLWLLAVLVSLNVWGYTFVLVRSLIH